MLLDILRGDGLHLAPTTSIAHFIANFRNPMNLFSNLFPRARYQEGPLELGVCTLAEILVSEEFWGEEQTMQGYYVALAQSC